MRWRESGRTAPVYGMPSWAPQAKDPGTGNHGLPDSSYPKPFSRDPRPPAAFQYGERNAALHTLLKNDEPDDFLFAPRRRFPWLKASVITIVVLLLAANLFMAVFEFHLKSAGTGAEISAGTESPPSFKVPSPATEAHTSPETTPVPEAAPGPDTKAVPDTRGAEGAAAPAADATLKPSDTTVPSAAAVPVQEMSQSAKQPDDIAAARATDSGVVQTSQPVPAPAAPAPQSESVPPQGSADAATTSSCSPAQRALGLCGWQANGASAPNK